MNHMNELFTIAPSLSPRLEWIIKHDIRTKEVNGKCEVREKDYLVPIGRGPTEDDAIHDLAVMCNLRLWNEQ